MAAEGDIPDGAVRVVAVDGAPVAVRRVGDRYFAIRNVCPHRAGPLGEGDVEGTLVTCPLHAWTFDLRTGTHVANPAVRVPTYPTRVHQGVVEVETGASGAPGPGAQASEPARFWKFGRS